MKPSFAHRVHHAFFALPGWLRPAVFCASVVTCIFLVRVVVAVPALLTGRATWSELGLALAAVVGAGFAGGLVHGVSRPPLRRLGKVGDYASGVAILYGYLGALMLASPYVFESSAIPETWGEAGFWLAFSTVLGIVFGHVLYAGPNGLDRIREQRSTPRVTRLQHDDAARTATLVSGWIRRADLESLLGELARAFGGGLAPGEVARIDQALVALTAEEEDEDDDDEGGEADDGGVEWRIGVQGVPVHLLPDEDLVQVEVLLEGELERTAETVRSLLGARTVDPLAV